MCTALHSLPEHFHSSYLLFPNPDWEPRPLHFMDQNWGLRLGMFPRVLQPAVELGEGGCWGTDPVGPTQPSHMGRQPRFRIACPYPTPKGSLYGGPRSHRPKLH